MAMSAHRRRAQPPRQPTARDLGLAFQLDEERLGSLKIFDNDENVVHPLNRHVHSWCCGPRVPWPFT
jgi:hypothetical protein